MSIKCFNDSEDIEYVDGESSLSTEDALNASAMLMELSDIEYQNESRDILREILKDEIESSSSDDFYH